MAKFARSYYKYAVFGAGALAGGALVKFSHEYYRSHLAHSSWTTNYEPSGVLWDPNWDRREGEYLTHPKKRSVIPEGLDLLKNTKDDKPVQSKAVRNIFMIRHGQYNLDGKTDAERTLTLLGRRQAMETGKRLKILDYPFNKIHVSTMSRAIETAQMISQSLPDVPVEQCALLEEGAPVPPDPPVGHWKPEVYQFFQDGPRIEAAFRNFFHRADPSQDSDSYELLVCHANVIRYFVCRAMQFPGEAWLRFSLYHASITWLQIYPNGRVTLRIYGEVGHMEPSNMTTLNYSKKRDGSQAPPEVDEAEKNLARSARTALAQLRSRWCRRLRNYQHRIDPGISDLCPDCSSDVHTVHHLFNCPANPTLLGPESLWTNPVEVAAFLRLEDE